MKYAYNLDREEVVLAQGYDINASFKDLGAVCDAIRYLRVDGALNVIDGIVSMQRPIPFKRYNKYMGSRHELRGRKGAYPIKAAKEISKVIQNAVANSAVKGMDQNSLYVVHASANKTRIERRRPSKGSWSWGRGKYGRPAPTRSDIEYAKVEIGLAASDAKMLTENMKRLIKLRNRVREAVSKPAKKAVAKPAVKQETKPKPVEKTAAKAVANQEAKKS